MLTIEHYNKLLSHIEYAHMNLNSIITKKCVVNDVEAMDLIIGVEDHLVVMQDILDFLVVKKVEDNK